MKSCGKKALARADIQDVHSRLYPVLWNHRIGHLSPPAVVSIFPVSGFPAAVPVVLALLDRKVGNLCLVSLGDPGKTITPGRLVDESDELSIFRGFSPKIQSWTSSRYACALRNCSISLRWSAPYSEMLRRRAPKPEYSFSMMQTDFTR